MRAMAESPKPRGWQGTDNKAQIIRTLDGHIAPYLRYEDRTTDEEVDLSNPHCI